MYSAAVTTVQVVHGTPVWREPVDFHVTCLSAYMPYDAAKHARVTKIRKEVPSPAMIDRLFPKENN